MPDPSLISMSELFNAATQGGSSGFASIGVNVRPAKVPDFRGDCPLGQAHAIGSAVRWRYAAPARTPAKRIVDGRIR